MREEVKTMKKINLISVLIVLVSLAAFLAKVKLTTYGFSSGS